LAKTVTQKEWPIGGKEGFVTDDGTFVDRIEGLRIAIIGICLLIILGFIGLLYLAFLRE